MIGRPSKLDDLTAKRIVDAIAAGGSRAAAAEAARVHRSTLMTWLARGRNGEQPYRDFLDRVKKAEAEAELSMVAIVRTAATNGTWQAAAWWLERRRSRTYALRREARENARPAVEMSGVTDADLLPLLENYVETIRSKKGRRDA